MENKIKVLLADDHQVMLDGLRALLQNEPDIRIVAEANTGLQVLNKLSEMSVDVVVLDIGMPEMDGYDTVLNMQKSHPNTKVLILSLHTEEKYIGKLLKAGVSGYIIKDKGSQEIVKAIRVVASGGDYFDSEVQKASIRAMQNKNAGPNKEIKFTPRELEVLHLIADGLSSRQIGEKLFISESTVETYRRNLLEKLSLPNSKHLLKYAIEKGYGKSPLS